MFMQPASDVRAVDFGHSIATLRLRSGDIHVLHGELAHVWRALAAGRGRCADDDTAAAKQLQRSGLLLPSRSSRVWPAQVRITATTSSVPSLGTIDAPAALDPCPRASLTLRLLAWVALMLVTFGLRLSSPHTVVTLIRLRPKLCPASTARAERAINAVRSAAPAAPGRAACLETSLAALAMLALHGRSADWLLGVATDPIRFHAWLQIDGQPIAEPPTTALYTPLPDHGLA